MLSNFGQPARFSSPGNRPRKNATKIDRLAALYDCFSELDTESKNATDGTILHVETLLRAHPPKHLSETQQEMRDLLLDLLLVYANGRSFDKTGSVGKTSIDTEGKFGPAGYLMTRTAGSEFAKKVSLCSRLKELDIKTQDQLLNWTQASGITLDEWQMIAPDFAELLEAPVLPSMAQVQASKGLTYQLTPAWMHDYITRAFLGTRSLMAMGSGIGNLPSRGFALAQYLMGSGEQSSNIKKPRAVSHFPNLTFSDSF